MKEANLKTLGKRKGLFRYVFCSTVCVLQSLFFPLSLKKTVYTNAHMDIKVRKFSFLVCCMTTGF